MNKITYIEQHLVVLNGKQVGIIKALYDKLGNKTGFRYFPGGRDGDAGDIYPTLRACQVSLES